MCIHMQLSHRGTQVPITHNIYSTFTRATPRKVLLPWGSSTDVDIQMFAYNDSTCLSESAGVTFLAPTYPGGIGNQTKTKRWCHDLRAVAIYANRQFCSTMMIAKDFTVNQYPSEGIHDFAP